MEILIYGWDWLLIKDCSFWGLVVLLVIASGLMFNFKFILKNPNKNKEDQNK